MIKIRRPQADWVNTHKAELANVPVRLLEAMTPIVAKLNLISVEINGNQAFLAEEAGNGIGILYKLDDAGFMPFSVFSIPE